MAETKKMNKWEKLLTVQQTLKAPKSNFNSFGKYHYRSCEDILEGLKPCLKEVKACVTIDDEIVQVGDHYYVKAQAMFIDCETGELISNTAYAREPESKTGMDLAQLTGATSSYARKYALNGVFMIDDTKDADTDENKIESDARGKKQDKAKTDETEKVYINATKQKALADKCESDGVHPSVIMEKCHVQDFSQITEKQFSFICNNWTKEFKGGK